MTSYRVTYKEPKAAPAIANLLKGSRVLPQDVPFVCPTKIELRSSDGDVFRFPENTQFTLVHKEEGVQLEVTGEVFSMVIAAWWRQNATCWICRNHASAALQLLVRPSRERENTDEYLLALGEMVVHDYDDNGRYFVICNLQQGQKAYVTYNPAKTVSPSRYSANVVTMSDEDWQYMSDNYFDHRNWM